MTQVCVLEEVLNWHDTVRRVARGPVEEQTVWQERAVGAVVVEPGDVLARGDFENAGDVDGGGVKVVVIFAVTVRCSGGGA